MPSIVDETLLSEPTDGLFPVIQLSGALVFSGPYWQYAVVGQSLSGSWSLFIMAGTALSGLAESLPGDRRRAAGGLHIMAILVLMCLLALFFLTPELLGMWVNAKPLLTRRLGQRRRPHRQSTRPRHRPAITGCGAR